MLIRLAMKVYAFSLLAICIDGVLVRECVQSNLDNLQQPVDGAILESHCTSVLAAVSMRRWDLPDTLILNDVTPFTVLTEAPFVRGERRQVFTAYVHSIAETSGCSDIPCLALALNDKLWSIRSPPIVFEPAPPNQLNSYSVIDTWIRGNGSCTSMAVFLTTALRLVGIPSRIAGVPHWNLGKALCPHGDASPACGNHNWVEVFVPSQGWSFIDQRRPDQQVLPLNQSWFYPEWTKGVSIRLAGNHSIYAASFMDVQTLSGMSDYPVGSGVYGLKGGHFPLAWDWSYTGVHAWDVSEAYQSESSPANVASYIIQSE